MVLPSSWSINTDDTLISLVNTDNNSDNVPPRPHKHKKMKHQRSMSSSDEEIQSTPDCTSCGEEFESESISEKEYTHAMMDR